MSLNAACSSTTEFGEPTLPEKMRTQMEYNLRLDWQNYLDRDTAARERYEEKVKTETACVYEACLLTSSLLEELKAKALELKYHLPDGSVLIQVGRSPWLLQEMMTALDMDVSWRTLPFSHKIGFARTESELAGCSNSEWTIDELPEPQKTWIASYISFLQRQFHITAEALAPFEGRIFIIDYVCSGTGLQDALELVNKAISKDLSITKIGFSIDGAPPYWKNNPKNIFTQISKDLERNIVNKHTLADEERVKLELPECQTDSYFENAHGHTFYPAEWADPIALARVSKPAPLTLTAAAKRQQIIDFASSHRSDKK